MKSIARALGLALRGFVREWRSGELIILLAALVVAVAALTGVGFLVQRIGIAIDRQASEVLAADLRLESPTPIAEADFQEARRDGLRTAHTVSMPSVVFLGDASQLSDLHAVSEGYPLRGTVKVAARPFAAGSATRKIPGRGEAWPSSKLLAALGGHLGSVLSIGAAKFRVTHVLISRPGAGATFASLAPAIILNAADLPETQLIQPGSRVRYAALFAGTRARIELFHQWLEAHKRASQRLRDIAEASPQIKDSVDRASRFLELASLVSVLLCSIAVAMAARQYVRRHLDAVALLKTLGATRALILGASLLELLLVAVAAALIGSGAGYLAQEWLLHAVRGLLSASLPPAGLAPVGMGLLAAIAVLAGFAVPPLMQLSRVPPMRVLRRDVGPPPMLVLFAFGPAVAAMACLMYWAVGSWHLFVDAVVGLVAFGLVLGGCGLGLVQGASLLRGRVGVAWRYGLANLSRRRADGVVQVLAFGAGIMVLLALGLVRRDLVSDWRSTLPADAPDYFFINITPQDRAPFVEFLTARGARLTRVLPMLRGRLTEIDGRSVAALRFSSPAGARFAHREQNLTWAAALAPGNKVIKGRWWTAEDYGKPFVSLATEMAHALGVGIGDRLTFSVGGETITATVASIRKVKWDSFQPNFFVVFVPGVLGGVTGTYLTSAYFHPRQGRMLAELVRRFPSVSVFDIDGLINEARSVMDKAILAVESVFGFTLLAGLTVLLAAVQASRDERRFESAMLRALGASTRTVLAGVLAEFTMIGLIAGLLAAAGASLAGAFVASRVLQVPYRPDAWVFAVGMLGGAFLVAMSGWLATRSAITQPPLASLRAG